VLGLAHPGVEDRIANRFTRQIRPTGPSAQHAFAHHPNLLKNASRCGILNVARCLYTIDVGQRGEPP